MADRDRCSDDRSPTTRLSAVFRPTVLALAPLACLLIILYVVFLHRYETFVAPYFPRAFDQLFYLHIVYSAYYSVSDAHSLGSAIRIVGAHVLDFKSLVFPLVSLVMAWIFGPDRTVMASVNFLMLSALAVTAFIVMRTIYSLRAAWLIVGLLLMSDSLYMFPGGLSDMRLDLSGLATFGIFVLMLFKLRTEPSPFNLVSAVLAFILAILTRSITGVYGVCAASLLLLFDVVRRFASDQSTLRLQMRNSLWLWACTVGSFSIFVVLFWHSLSDYYLGHLSSGEVNLRLAENGLRDRSQLPSYYLLSAEKHLGFMSIAFGCIAAIQAVGLLMPGRPRMAAASDILEARGRLANALIVAGAAILAVVVPLSSYSPNPIVIGVVTVPLVCLFVAGQQALSEYLQRESLDKWMTRSVVVVGAGYFVLNQVMGVPGAPQERHLLREHNLMYQQILEDFRQLGGKIAWAVVLEGANSAAFDIFLYESGFADAVPRFAQRDISLFPLGIDEIRSMIENVDAFVAYRDPPPGFDYPSTVSLRDTQAQWQPIVDRDFVVRREVDFNPVRLTYYLRTPRVISLYAPNGLGEIETKSGNAGTDFLLVRKSNEEIERKNGVERLLFWLDRRFAAINVENLRDTAVPATFSMTVAPGPSFVDQTSRTIRLAYGDRQWELRVSADTGWRLEIPLKVPPGRSQITLMALDPLGERLAIPHVPGLFNALVKDIQLRGQGGPN